MVLSAFLDNVTVIKIKFVFFNCTRWLPVASYTNFSQWEIAPKYYLFMSEAFQETQNSDLQKPLAWSGLFMNSFSSNLLSIQTVTPMIRILEFLTTFLFEFLYFKSANKGLTNYIFSNFANWIDFVQKLCCSRFKFQL